MRYMSNLCLPMYFYANVGAVIQSAFEDATLTMGGRVVVATDLYSCT